MKCRGRERRKIINSIDEFNIPSVNSNETFDSLLFLDRTNVLFSFQHLWRGEELLLKYADQDFTIVEISKELLEKINTKEILINGTFYPLIKFNPFKIPIVSLSLSTSSFRRCIFIKRAISDRDYYETIESPLWSKTLRSISLSFFPKHNTLIYIYMCVCV